MRSSISRSAARLRWLVFVAMTVLAAVYLVARLHLQVSGVHIEYLIHGMDSRVGEIVGDISMALLLISLFVLTQMLRRIAHGELFSAGVVRSFRIFALWLLLLALFQLIAPAALHFAEIAPSGRHELRLAIDMRNILTVGITLLLFLLARLLERARQIEDEMREIV